MRLKPLQTNRQFMIGNSIVFIGVIFVVVLFIYLSLRMQAQKSDHHYYNEVYNIGLVQGFAGHDFAGRDGRRRETRVRFGGARRDH